MYFGERGADLAAVRRRWRSDHLALQSGHQRCRLAVQFENIRPLNIDRRCRAGYSTLRQMSHQSEIEGQFGRCEFFEQGQHIAPAGGGHKIVGILDAGGDALHPHQRSQAVEL